MRAALTTLKIVVGYCLACLAAGATQIAFVVTPFDLLALPLDDRLMRLGGAGLLTLFAANQTAIFAFPFALAAIAFAAWNKIHALSYFVIAGLIIAACGLGALYAGETPDQASIVNAYGLSAYLTAGVIGGFVYWLIAGRRTIRNSPATPPRSAAQGGNTPQRP